MIDHAEKSTEVPVSDAARAEVAPGIWLDGRLGLFHEEQNWLAVADLHYGYEVGRRMAGGLWPMWGMESIEARLRDLVQTYNPKTLILVGDIVDGRAAPDEAVAWMSGLEELCEEVVFVEGNHDRGEVKRHFRFVDWYRRGRFFFHHGHDPNVRQLVVDGDIEVTGHRHPAVTFRDGAGTRLKLPALVREDDADETGELWTLPAFSPWAGGGHYEPTDEGSFYREWACSPQRVFEVIA